MRGLSLSIVYLLMMLPSVGSAQTSFPMLMSLQPLAAQVGQTSEHTVHARYDLSGAYQVMITGDGVVGQAVLPEEKPEENKDAKDPKKKKPALQKLKLRFTVAPDAQPGVREFRIATPQGASTIGQLVIVSDPVITEQAKNDTAEDAQEITLPATVCGAIEKNEDVDFYKFQAKAGQSLSFHVRSMRLQDKIHDLQTHADPILTLRNATGTTLASSDNYFYGDPLINHKFTNAGEYLIEIRDVRYKGNQYWRYSIEINDRPFVTNVHPMGVALGKPTELQLIGFQLPEKPLASVTLPMEVATGAQELSLPMKTGLTNPVPLVVNDLPPCVETDADNNTPETAQTISVPCGASGRIENPEDIDHYVFEAKKGERFSFQVTARRRQSALDSHLRILNLEGKQLSLNDDMKLGRRTYADSWIENWTAPADGKFILEIRDLHLRGGPQFVYFIEASRSQPYFELLIDTDKTLLTPGTCSLLFLRAVRKNGFEGEIQLHVDGLPQGVTANCGRILSVESLPANQKTRAHQDGCIVLEAATGAPMSVANITVRGTATHKVEGQEPLELSTVAAPYQETYQPGGGRGHWPVENHTISIGRPNDIRGIQLSTYEITLEPGGSQKIDVTLERSPEYTKNITLDVIYKHLNSTYGNALPYGVTIDASKSKTLLDGKTNAGFITLQAAKDAPPVEKQQTAILAHVSVNFVMKTTFSSKPLLVTVSKPPEAEAAKPDEAKK